MSTWLLADDSASEDELRELAAEWRAIAAVQRRIAYINALDLSGLPPASRLRRAWNALMVLIPC